MLCSDVCKLSFSPSKPRWNFCPNLPCPKNSLRFFFHLRSWVQGWWSQWSQMVPHVEAAKGRGTKQHRGIAPPLHCRVFYFCVGQGAVAAGAVAVRFFCVDFWPCWLVAVVSCKLKWRCVKRSCCDVRAVGGCWRYDWSMIEQQPQPSWGARVCSSVDSIK